MPLDMSKYLGLFVSEATEHLEAMGRDLVELEKVDGPGAVDSLFRHAHSVKGMASSMGFEPIAQLAHRVEDLVDHIRKEPSKKSRELVDLMLSAADVLLTQVRAAGDGQTIDPAKALLDALGEQVLALTGRAPERTRVANAVVSTGAGASAGASGAASPGGANGSGSSGTSDGVGASGGAGASGGGVGAAGASAVGASGVGASGVGAPVGADASQVGASAVGAAGGAGAGMSDAGGAGGGAGASGLGAIGVSASGGAGASGVGAAGGAGVSGLGAAGATGATSRAGTSATPTPSEAHAQEPAQALGAIPRFSVRLRVLPTCQAPGVRAFLVHRRLSSLGNLFDLKPPLEDLKAGRLPDGRISLEIETSGGGDAVEQVLRNIPEVELIGVAPVVYGEPPVVPPATPEAPRVIGVEPQRSVRVRTELLDVVLDSVGELMLATARLRELAKSLPDAHREAMEEGVYRTHQLVRDLHGKVMSVRMTPLSTITDRLPRAARDIARKRGREVDLVITGAEIELDRAILDELADPLLHILRNSIDHGVEPPDERAAAGKGPRGRVLVSVSRQRDRVVVEIEDDGRGMDPEKLRAAAVARDQLTAEQAARLTDREALMLCCLPGVSTARDVSEISGRGVGMDAVKKVVENVGGTLELESEKGRGTRVILRLPLTVAVVNLLLVRLGAEIFGLPIAKVAGAVEVNPAALSRSLGAPMLPHGSGLIPVRGLSELLSVPDAPPEGARPYVVMEADPGRVALAVDGLVGQEEAVLKPLGKPLDLVPGLSGVTILGTGRPVFILDVPRLLA